MQPEAQITHISPEQSRVQARPTIESVPTISTPELDTRNSAERYEQIAEASAVSSDVGLTTTIPVPVISSAKVDENTTISDTPAQAKDVDLIEREWVDKAKKIVTETKDDPYKREQAVNKLQIDYLKKRYGRDLGVAE